MADTTTELEVLNQIVDVLGGQSGQYETVVPTLQQILTLLGGGGGGGGYNPALSVGRADALTGADETAQWATRESTGSGSAIVRSVQGAAVVWNQMVGSDTSSVTVPSGHKYLGIIGGTAAIATSDGTAVSVTGGTDQLFDLTAMFGSGNEPSTVAEFGRMYPEAYYPYSAPTLKPVQIAGISSVGFNQWDEEWELGTIAGATGQNLADSNTIRSKNYNSCFPSMDYYIKAANFIYVFWYDTEKNFISRIYLANNVSQSPANAAYFRIRVDGTATYNHNICINVSNPALNGQYKPYTTDAIEWTAQTLRAAGSVRDELTADELVTRVGERAYQSGDESDAAVRTDGTTTYYPLVTPTTTPINPALPMAYRVQQGGSESIIVPDGEISAAPILTVAEGESAADVVMDALACIAAPDGPVATANHSVGTYLTMQGKLYKVTSAIAVGESIVAGTNVSQTTVMAELLALTA